MEPLSPQDVAEAIKAHGLTIEIQTFDASTATSMQAAENIGTSLGSIVKSLVFMVQDQPIVALTSGDQTVDDRKIAAIYEVGRKRVKIAKPEQCIEHVGYAPGGVPPFGHRTEVPIYIDESLQRFDLLYAAGGSPNAIFPIPFATLVEKTGGIVTNLIKD